jgi:hypothetical protein
MPETTPLSPTGNVTWIAARCGNETGSGETIADSSWLPLVAVPGGGEPQPGRAGIAWAPSSLRVEAVFHGESPHNRAARLNERAWEMGDVFELFLQAAGSSNYVEIHVTPENQRLQLAWPHGGLARVRAKQERLETFLVSDPAWVSSRTRLDGDKWHTTVHVPASIFGIARLSPLDRFRAAVCRYHYVGNPSSPVLSTTARLATAGFHQPTAWHELCLGEEQPHGSARSNSR